MLLALPGQRVNARDCCSKCCCDSDVKVHQIKQDGKRINTWFTGRKYYTLKTVNTSKRSRCGGLLMAGDVNEIIGRILHMQERLKPLS